MALLTTQQITEAGAATTYADAAELGDTITNTGKEFIHVKNGSGASVTVSCDPDTASVTVAGYGSLSKAAISVAIPSGDERFIGPFGTAAFGASPLIEYSAHADVTIAAITL